jgi:hypothetical protein
LVFLVFFILTTSQYSSGKQVSDTEPSSSITPDVRIPSEERLKEISEMKKYWYNEPPQELSWWDKFIIKLQEWAREMLQNSWVEYFLKGSAILIFIFILIALINQILKGEIRSAITGKKDRMILNLNIDEGDLTRSNIDELITKALNQKNYSLAVRYIYQKSLLLLKEKELIHFKHDKTNYEYLRELNDHPSASYFDRLTYFHEYIDYGHFEIDKTRFQTVEEVFLQFQKTLNA